MLGYESAEALLAAPPAELINAFEMFDEERRPLPLEELPGRLALTGVATPERLVLYRVRATGEERWSLIRARPILAADGSVEAAVNVLHDVTDRRRREEAVRFVADAGVILSSSLDVETTLASVARLAVPRIADWCIVYMREEDGNIRRLAIEHAGGDAEAVGEVLDRYPLDVEAEVGVPYVVRTGQTLLLADVSAQGLMADVVDPEALAAELKHIALASYLCVPLIARGRTLGAISLLSSESGRRFGPDEKELAEQLAGRAALAVDNGRLYREAEQAAASERRRSEQLLRLSQAALLVNAADLDELLAVLTARAREIVGAARAVTTIGDAAEGEATVKAVAGLGTPPQDGRPRRTAPRARREDARRDRARRPCGPPVHRRGRGDPRAARADGVGRGRELPRRGRARAPRRRAPQPGRPPRGGAPAAALGRDHRRARRRGGDVERPGRGDLPGALRGRELQRRRRYAGSTPRVGRTSRGNGRSPEPSSAASPSPARRSRSGAQTARADHRGERGARACGRRGGRGGDDLQRRHGSRAGRAAAPLPRRGEHRPRLVARLRADAGGRLGARRADVGRLVLDLGARGRRHGQGRRVDAQRSRAAADGRTRCGRGGRCGSTTRPRPRR